MSPTGVHILKPWKHLGCDAIEDNHLEFADLVFSRLGARAGRPCYACSIHCASRSREKHVHWTERVDVKRRRGQITAQISGHLPPIGRIAFVRLPPQILRATLGPFDLRADGLAEK